ncbi:CsbD family protein [Candidatus Solirubrobacter pratensis]|uniref:CsbD family protein n=1 Tax=Candidatus Solirubrobacter pratensis TaxID=1298857 RepID=UPI000404D512|nr:CsbD family protein [Candidatus Solirubrobacter pratensis]
MRSSRRDRAAGAVDTLAGRVLEAFGKLTGKRSTAAKGKAARGRGAGRSAKGRVKRGARR